MSAHLLNVSGCLPLCDPSIHVCISMCSLSSGTHKPKDPPWLALVQSEHKKKKAPAPPSAGQATPPYLGSLSSLKGEDSRPSTPPSPANPFDEDDNEGEENNTVEEEGSKGPPVPATVAAGHPWYSITQAAEPAGADDPPSAGSSSRSASPGGTKSKKRPAPRAPHPPTGTQEPLPPGFACVTTPRVDLGANVRATITVCEVMTSLHSAGTWFCCPAPSAITKWWKLDEENRCFNDEGTEKFFIHSSFFCQAVQNQRGSFARLRGATFFFLFSEDVDFFYLRCRTFLDWDLFKRKKGYSALFALFLRIYLFHFEVVVFFTLKSRPYMCLPGILVYRVKELYMVHSNKPFLHCEKCAHRGRLEDTNPALFRTFHLEEILITGPH